MSDRLRADKIPPSLRALHILERVAQGVGGMTSAELEVLLGVPKASIHRIAQQLEEDGFLQREPGKKRFIAGPRARVLALAVHGNSAISAPRHAILTALSQEIEETCNCTVLDGSELVYFDRVEANWPYRIQLPTGSRHPLHCTASGKLLLANLDVSRRRSLLSAYPLKQYTERTITDRTALEKELDRIRESGVGTDNEEYLPGMVAVAVPVLSNANSLEHTIAVHAPTIRKPLPSLMQYLPTLRHAASAMAATLIED